MIAATLLVVSLAVLPSAGQSPVGAQAGTASHVSFEQLSRQAEKARDQNHDDDAIQLYRRALARRPEWEQGLWYLATLLYDKEQYAPARDTFRRFLTLRPDAGPAWALLGLSEFQTREYPRALDHLQRAMATGMGDRKDLIQSVFYYVVILLTRMERYDDSMAMLMRMLASGSDSSLLVEPAGLAGLRLPLLPAEIPPDRRQLVDLAGKAVVALETHHYEDAEASFKQLESAYPNEPGVHFLYGAYLMPLHPEEGIREMQRELEISPSHVLARIRLAQQYLAQQEPDKALPLAEEAVKLDPKRASAHMLAGEALVAKGDLAGGTKELETARDDDPLNTRIHWDLLRAYNAAGRGEDAKHEKEIIEKLNRPESGNGAAQDKKSSDPATK
jgi:tetratricopeptide (TPR) repeat protein